MSQVTSQQRFLHLNHEELLALQEPKDGIVLESEVAPGRFELAEGPFTTWVRTLEVQPHPSGVNGLEHEDGLDRSPPDQRFRVTETVEWRLAVPVFWVLFWLPIRWHVARGMQKPSPWWAPSDRLDARAARVIGLLGLLAVVNGYLGTVIGQTLTFAADEFCDTFATNASGIEICVDPSADTSARGDILSIVRVAVVLSLVLSIAADRFGRRAAIRVGIILSTAATALGALAPNLVGLTTTQIFARGLATGLAILIGIVAAEELPTRARAYGLGMLILLAGLGSGMVVWVLPLADVALWGWRLVYAMALVFLPVSIWASAALPQTKRFASQQPTTMRSNLGGLFVSSKLRSRLILLSASTLLAALFASPASQFDNDFLRAELGFDATRVSLFTVVTSTPIGVGVMAGGILADRLGRRPIGALGVSVGTLMTAWSFFAGEPEIWVIRTIGTVFGAGFAIAALAVYGPELFPTRLRSTANGIITAAGVLGTVIGLQIVGNLEERWGNFGEPLLLVAAGPLLVVILILVAYPETANKTLEQINDEPELI